MGKYTPWKEKEKELCNWLIAMLMLGGLEKFGGRGQTAISILMTEIHLSGRYEDFCRTYNLNMIKMYKHRVFRPEFEVSGTPMPTRPDWLPIEFRSLGNNGFTCEDIARCVNLLHDASKVGGPPQVEANAKSKLDVEKSPQITGSTSAPSASAVRMKNPFKANPSAILLPPLSQYLNRRSSSVASTGLSHTYMSDHSNHAQQPQSTFKNKETAAPNIIEGKAEGAA